MRIYLKKRIEELSQLASEVRPGAARAKYSLMANELKLALFEYNRWMQEENE